MTLFKVADLFTWKTIFKITYSRMGEPFAECWANNIPFEYQRLKVRVIEPAGENVALVVVYKKGE